MIDGRHRVLRMFLSPRVRFQPTPELGIQRGIACPGQLASGLDEGLVSAESDVRHCSMGYTSVVYTMFVYVRFRP